jgi:putative ABC transport system permease protein
MILLYVKLAIRTFLKQRLNSFINLFGLCTGLTFSLLIFLWVQDEFNFDKSYPEHEQILGILKTKDFGDKVDTNKFLPGPIGEVLRSEIAGIELAATMNTGSTLKVMIDEQVFATENRAVETDFFQIFQPSIVTGIYPEGKEDWLVITKSTAEKWFGHFDCNGKQVTYNNKSYVILGVIEDFSINSSFYGIESFTSFDRLRELNASANGWSMNAFLCFVKLQRGANLASVNAMLNESLAKYVNDPSTSFFTKSLEDLYLRDKYENGVSVGGKISYVKTFGAIGLFILIIACINFMNLATAQAVNRSKEIGISKAAGASRLNLRLQYLIEALVFALLAFAVSILAIELLIPYVNSLTQKQLVIQYQDPKLWVGFLSVVFLTGLIAGSYPAFFISSLNIIKVLKGNVRSGKSAIRMRSALVVVQFSLSIILVICTLFVHEQIRFIQEANLGLDKEHVILYYPDREAFNRFDAFKEEIEAQESLTAISRSNNSPIEVGSGTWGIDWEAKDPDKSPTFWMVFTDEQFIPATGISIIDGENFKGSFAKDSTKFILNRKAAEYLGYDNPIGKRFDVWGSKGGEIIGVVEDFNMHTLRKEVEPMFLIYNPLNTWMMVLRYKPAQAQAAIDELRAVHEKFMPGYPLEFRFLDDQFNAQYASENLTGKLSSALALVGIIISCLGLFSLAAFSIQQRLKEIGVRKVLGASISSLVWRLSSSFSALVIVATVISLPIAYFLIQNWLSEFAYKIEISPWLFAIGAIASFVIAWFTVAYHSYRFSSLNPAKTLKDE